MQFFLLNKQDMVEYDKSKVVLGQPLQQLELSFSIMGYNILKLGVLPHRNIDNATVEVEDLQSSSHVVQADGKVTIFNTEGVDQYGNKFKNSLNFKKDELSVLFLGFDLKLANLDTYTTKLKINNFYTLELIVHINNEQSLGYEDIDSLSRLNWLNSTKGIDRTVPQQFSPISIEKNVIYMTHKHLKLSQNGLIENAFSCLTESLAPTEEKTSLLSKPMFIGADDIDFKFALSKIDTDGYSVKIKAIGDSQKLTLYVDGELFYDGYLKYNIKFVAKEGVILDNIKFSTDFAASKYSNGFGLGGGNLRELVHKFDAVGHNDAIFVGNTNIGAHFKFKDIDYVRPLVNIYYNELPLRTPECWNNQSKGSVSIKKSDIGATLDYLSGQVIIPQGKEYNLYFDMFVTPFGAIDFDTIRKVRYSHNNRLSDYNKEIDDAYKNKLTYINIHHATEVNPFINYPFLTTEKLKKFVDEAHADGIGVKIYYNLREMSNHTKEVYAYKELGNEIIYRHCGEGYPWKDGKDKWLTETFGNEIIPAWKVIFKKGSQRGKKDVSFIVQPDSRLKNYYIEGLDYLVKNVGIDGIYIDDTCLDRFTLERARKILNQKPGILGNIDMHTWNHQEALAGNISSIHLYTELLPFIDRMWIGEGYNYKDSTEDYLLTEISGIPYGKTSEMLNEGGNPFIGLLYGMNVRYNWCGHTANKRSLSVNQIWDSFKNKHVEMIGYWDSQNPVSFDCPNIKATIYKSEKQVVVCLFNFGLSKEVFDIGIDPEKLGFDTHNFKKLVKSYKGIQRRRYINLDTPIKLKSKCGLIITIKA